MVLGLLAVASGARANGITIDVAPPGQPLPGDTTGVGGMTPASPSDGDTLVAAFRLRGLFSEDNPGLGDDLAATVTLLVELRKANKPFWSSGRVAAVAFTYRFRRDALDGSYEVLTPGGTLVELADRATLSRYLERVHEIEVAVRGTLEREKLYRVHVTAVVKPMDLDDPETMESWLSGTVSNNGALLGIPKFIWDASIKLSGLGDKRAEAQSEPFLAWPVSGR